MARVLPRIRPGLDVFPSPMPERPGLVFRDPFKIAKQVLIIPQFLAQALRCFDGEQTLTDAQAYLSRLANELVPGTVIENMLDALQINGFLITEEYEQLRQERIEAFAQATVRRPAHAGSGYPAQRHELRKTLGDYLGGSHEPELATPSDAKPLIGIAAPHVSPFGGVDCYAAAYNQLRGARAAAVKQKTIVLLGTSHYGQPERFGVTRKPFLSPYGLVEPDLPKLDWLIERAGESVIVEDYAHAIEHSLEFQCIFLQHVLGSEFKILPILCGPFAKALQLGEPPEHDDEVYRFFDTLAEFNDLHQDELFWVLGIDLAHIGRRYGDDLIARVNEGAMLEVADDDHERLRLACNGQTEEFFELVKPEEDRLKWCGLSPLYTFLQAVPQARGKVLQYDQWNIDAESVVSFAALAFEQEQ